MNESEDMRDFKRKTQLGNIPSLKSVNYVRKVQVYCIVWHITEDALAKYIQCFSNCSFMSVIELSYFL